MRTIILKVVSWIFLLILIWITSLVSCGIAVRHFHTTISNFELSNEIAIPSLLLSFFVSTILVFFRNKLGFRISGLAIIAIVLAFLFFIFQHQILLLFNVDTDEQLRQQAREQLKEIQKYNALHPQPPETAEQKAADERKEIELAVNIYNGRPTKIKIGGIGADYAWADTVPDDPERQDSARVFLQRDGANWVVTDYGSGATPPGYQEEHGTASAVSAVH